LISGNFLRDHNCWFWHGSIHLIFTEIDVWQPRQTCTDTECHFIYVRNDLVGGQ